MLMLRYIFSIFLENQVAFHDGHTRCSYLKTIIFNERCTIIDNNLLNKILLHGNDPVRR